MAEAAESLEPLTLPEDPVLAEWATAVNRAGHWAYVYDSQWRVVFATDELRLSWGDMGAIAAMPLGCHSLSAQWFQFRAAAVGGPWSERGFRRAAFLRIGPLVLASMPGGRDELRRIVDPDVADLVDELQPRELARVRAARTGFGTAGVEVGASNLVISIDDDQGQFAGVCELIKPAVGMTQLALAAATADVAHLERMHLVARPDRRPTAILMADLEASSPLARRLPTAQYFAFGRRLVRGADRCIVDAGGIVGRHAGDGVVAYFLAETVGSESAAARSCIAASRNLRRVLAEIAARSEIPASELSLRFGLHWGATLYMGRIITAGRSEVTALGDEVNETARIEACATGGRTLASKSLIERLGRADAELLGLDPSGITYTQLADLDTATDKARRDAPAIAVCDINELSP
jgi:class 3 adenylate cyclase